MDIFLFTLNVIIFSELLVIEISNLLEFKDKTMNKNKNKNFEASFLYFRKENFDFDLDYTNKRMWIRWRQKMIFFKESYSIFYIILKEEQE